MKKLIIKAVFALIIYLGAINVIDIYSPKFESNANLEMLNGNLDSYERNQVTKKTVKWGRITCSGLFAIYLVSAAYKETKKQTQEKKYEEN